MSDERLARVEDKLDRVAESLAAVATEIKGQARRTAALEKDFGPVRAHVARVDGAVKLISVVATILGVLAGLAKFLS